jgi:hypothetical protein
VPELQEKVQQVVEGKKFYERVNAGDLEINRLLVMVLKLSGCGTQDGVLNLNVVGNVDANDR